MKFSLFACSAWCLLFVFSGSCFFGWKRRIGKREEEVGGSEARPLAALMRAIGGLA